MAIRTFRKVQAPSLSRKGKEQGERAGRRTARAQME